MLNHLCSVFFFVFLVIITTDGSQSTTRPTVTNNDIRDAILQIVNVIRTTEDKLERHEYRERSLGEQLKRGLISIDKRVKQWDHFKGAITRLDERLAAVETILIQKEERERQQSVKIFDVVDDIQKNLPLIMEELKKDILEEFAKQKKNTPPPLPQLPPRPEISKQDVDEIKKDIQKLNENFKESVGNISKEVKNTKSDTKTCNDLNTKTSAALQNFNQKLDQEKLLLEEYEKKLNQFEENSKEPPAQIKEQADWQVNFLKSMKEQKQRIEDLQYDVKNVSQKLNTVPQNDDIETIKNNTNELVKAINENTDTRARNVLDGIKNDLRDVKYTLSKEHEKLQESLVDLTNATDDFAKNYIEMKSDLQSIKKVDGVMVQTADNVLDTKRRLEYGVHQILGEMGQLMKTATKEIASTISDRFDVFELSVLDEENGALANLTHKIGDEIDQVWRQIGIMHQKMNANADILTKLQNQTDSYVNGSSNIMDNMKGKVAKITSKIVELDENLNYLMGRLMLVSHEFNQIKTGLSKALDEIKGTFHAVQSKIKDPGPGPHKIDENDEEPDVSPARKRSVN